ncbi:SpoIIE family protein phosphatase [Labrenzia polysiphoniae]|uniref:SpoIIE family protein phosphatase n=1 Tax=Roseibium polysiphoniae TaxID=2571221 RepID=A0ABR9CAZ0_9HYPH|nr:SpoIIE family protein phosphatase [Roseibium polysiphoniae]
MTSFWRQLASKPILFAVIVVLSLAFLPLAVWLDLRNLSEESLRSQATDLNQVITDIRGYYSRNVIGRVLENDGTAVPSHEYAEIPGGIPIPATLSLELGDVIGNRARNLQYRFVSDFPFAKRDPHNLDAFETRALSKFRASRNAEDLLYELDGSVLDRRIRIAAPVVMGETCVACHNSHPESPKKDWAVGDIRGIQAVMIAQPIAQNLLSFKYLLIYFAIAGVFGAAFSGMQWRQAMRFDRMNRQLETANAEISGLNQKLTSENMRLGAEIDIARRIQMMVLPTLDELGGIQKVEIAAYMEPADEVGGDYYDVLQVGGRIKVGIGDVTGHGLESGVLMLMVQSVTVALQERGVVDPCEFLDTLNRAICHNIERTGTDKHLTLCFLDYEDHKITLSGQHEDVLVLPRVGDMETVDTGDLGFPIGLDKDISTFVATHEIPFTSGDIIVLHTDGVTEAESPTGELFGMDRLRESLRRHRTGDAKEIAQGIIDDLKHHIGTQKVHDDITLVVMRHN